MTALLFARAGCTVRVLEKHADFFRDFRGDTVHPWRLVVPREDKSTRSGRKQPDVIDVVCWSAVTRRAAGRLQIGQDVEVEGALRRRFFRTAAGVGSRYEVEARSLTRLRIESLP